MTVSALLRRRFGVLFLLAFFCGFPCAQTRADFESPTQESARSAQGAFIQSLGDKAISILKDKALSEEERDATFRKLLSETFDLETIARFVIGRSWLSATPEQKSEYLKLFEELIVKTYSDRFSLYTSEGFVVRAATPEGTKDFVVNSEITRPNGGKPTAVTWRLRQKNDKIRIIDVVIEGVSMSVTQRQEYSSIIERNGGNIEALLSLMRERIASADGKKS